jgi:hypothetical protein
VLHPCGKLSGTGPIFLFGTIMSRSRTKHLTPWLNGIAPALFVLLVTIAFSAFFGDPHLSKGWPAVGRTFLRFIRFVIILCLPLYTLVPIYGFIIVKTKGVLLHLHLKQDFALHRLKHWVFRPFQGIGIGLLFSTKLLTILQLIAGPTVTPSLLIPEGHFEFSRFLVITAIAVFISLLLSVLWTLDDMGIRYFNRKNQELKMIGKYAGTFVPVVFGAYGLLSLLAHYPAEHAFAYTFKIIVVLYPPLAVFSIAHAYFLKKKAGLLFSKTALKRGNIVEHD